MLAVGVGLIAFGVYQFAWRCTDRSGSETQSSLDSLWVRSEQFDARAFNRLKARSLARNFVAR